MLIGIRLTEVVWVLSLAKLQGCRPTNPSTTIGYWYYPMNDTAYEANYGLLYNWPAVMHGASGSNANPSGVQGICPDGWHVPSDAECTQLLNYVNSQSQRTCAAG